MYFLGFKSLDRVTHLSRYVGNFDTQYGFFPIQLAPDEVHYPLWLGYRLGGISGGIQIECFCIRCVKVWIYRMDCWG